MDPVTHSVVGAMAACSISGKERWNVASVSGACAGLLADLETFIYLPSDPLFNLEVHRQFTHSLLFIPAGALIAAGLLWLVMSKYSHFRELYLWSLAGYATHWFMDVITSYGTELFWPFVETRYAWNLVSVVDPLFTAGLILFTGLALWLSRKWLVGAAWGWVLMILLTGLVQNHRAGESMKKLASDRGHSIERSVVKPTIGNQLLWRTTYIANDSVFTDAARTGLVQPVLVYHGEGAPLVDISEEFSTYKSTTLYSDLERFERLSESYLIRHPEIQQVVGDARYSMLPTSLVPLWGVVADTTQPETHVPFLYFRDSGEEVRRAFLDMLLGGNK